MTSLNNIQDKFFAGILTDLPTLFILSFLAFLPTLIAGLRNRRDFARYSVLNLLLVWATAGTSLLKSLAMPITFLVKDNNGAYAATACDALMWLALIGWFFALGRSFAVEAQKLPWLKANIVLAFIVSNLLAQGVFLAEKPMALPYLRQIHVQQAYENPYRNMSQCGVSCLDDNLASAPFVAQINFASMRQLLSATIFVLWCYTLSANARRRFSSLSCPQVPSGEVW